MSGGLARRCGGPYSKNDVDATCGKLAGFLAQVADFRKARKLTAAQAGQMTAAAGRIRAVLDC